MTAVAKATTQR